MSARILAMIEEARRRLYKEIDRRAEHALGRRNRSTVNRSVGQRYRRKHGTVG